MLENLLGDILALGIIIYFLLLVVAKFSGKSVKDIIDKIKEMFNGENE